MKTETMRKNDLLAINKCENNLNSAYMGIVDVQWHLIHS